MKYDCIFTGGSVRGLCYVGVLKAIEELNIKFDKRIGSSIGALMMTFYTLGYSVDEIEDVINELELWKLFVDFNFNILSDLAISRGEKYLKWLREKIEVKFYGMEYKKGKMPPVTFKDIDEDIIITATNLLDSSQQVFSKNTTPDFEIALALRASSAMPFLMPKVKFEDKYLIDGDISRGRPIWKLLDNISQDKILEFRITGGNKNKITKNPVQLVNSIINTAAYIIDNDAAESYKNNFNIIEIDVEDVSFIDFALNKKQKEKIYKTGYSAVMEHFKGKYGTN